LKAIKKWGRGTPDDLSKITQPTLIANGDNDRMVPSTLSEDLHRRIEARSWSSTPTPGTAASSSSTTSSLPSPSSSSTADHRGCTKEGRSYEHVTV
jgi:hypothetical protein